MTEKIDALLAPHRVEIGDDFSGYRNHCQRVAAFCLALIDDPAAYADRVAIAAAYHDLGIWSAKTWDYLPPSVALAREHLVAIGRPEWEIEITSAIDDHHKATPTMRRGSPLVEAFRKADLVDVSLGIVRFGLEKMLVRTVRDEFPNAGFHQTLIRFSTRAILTTPLRPMPMMKM